MNYKKLKPNEFFKKITNEQSARSILWQARFGGKKFQCPKCSCEKCYEYSCDPEIRKCRECHHRVRLRVGTIFQDSTTPLLMWVRAIFFVMQDKRGTSALQLQRQLGMKSYGTVWSMLHKIRAALGQRDDTYKLGNVIELDGATFGKKETGNQLEVLVAIETKDWVDEKGKKKSKAGFAKIMVAQETSANARKFANKNFAKGAMVNTDGSPALRTIPGFDVDYQVTNNDPKVLDKWLPWVHRFISNAKAWIVGTHHGVETKYLEAYLIEYTYRFNRRHDPDGLFHRAMTACLQAKPVKLGSTFR
jgi:hypothetical protein